MQDAQFTTPNDPTLDVPPLPDTVEACHALIFEQAKAIAATMAQLNEARAEAAEFEVSIQQLMNRLYGRRSERSVDPNQLPLDFGNDPELRDAIAEAAANAAAEAEIIVEEIVKRRKVKKASSAPRNEKFPEHLPRVEEIINPPDDELVCPTHGEKTLIGYDTTETLEHVPPKAIVRVRKYAKYACVRGNGECGVSQASRLPGLVEGNRYDTSIAAQVITNKYAYHMSLYREQDLFASIGWIPSRSTLVNIQTASTELLRPVAYCARDLVLGDGVVGCDDTHVTLITPKFLPAFDPDDPRSVRMREVLQKAIENGDPSVTARMWAYRSTAIPLNYFDFTISRHRDGPKLVLGDFGGILMGDCYAGFEALVVRSDCRFERAACWAHARRKFRAIANNHPLPAAVMLAMIRQLYDIEDRARYMTPEERQQFRELHARPVLIRIKAYLDGPVFREALPKSDLAKAGNYVRNNWNELQTYLRDGRCPLDNNDTEQLMRQIALGRKNWLFVGSVAGGERAAILMTLVSSAIRNDLDVAVYLEDIMDRLLEGCQDYESLCPHQWRLRHPEAIREYRQDERRDAEDRRTVNRAKRRIEARAASSTAE
jgi:transposase